MGTGPRGLHLSRHRSLSCDQVQCPVHMQLLVLGWGLPEISSKNREIKSALIKSHTGTWDLEGPCHLPTALIVHS